MTGDSDDVELRHKSGESLELQAAVAQSTTVVVTYIFKGILNNDDYQCFGSFRR